MRQVAFEKSYASVHVDITRSEGAQGKRPFTFSSFRAGRDFLRHENKVHLCLSRSSKHPKPLSSFPHFLEVTTCSREGAKGACTFANAFFPQFIHSALIVPRTSGYLTSWCCYHIFAAYQQSFLRLHTSEMHFPALPLISPYFPLTVVRTFTRSQLFPYFTPCRPQVLAAEELRSA